MDFRQAIPWVLLEQHLRESIKEIGVELESAQDIDSVRRAQGELSRLRKLLNLPATLEIKYKEVV